MSENQESKQRLRSAANSKIPIASVISDPDTFRRAVALLKRAVVVVAKASELKEEEGEIKAELAAICEAYELDGLKHGLNGFEYHGYTTRKTLSKEKLLALGVSAEQIAEAYVDSDPYLNTRTIPFDIP